MDIQNKLQDVRNPTAAMMVLLREMDLETDSDVGGDGPVAADPSVRTSLSQLYSSSCAVSAICQAVCHAAMTRARFCRDLLILQKLYLRFGDDVRPRAAFGFHLQVLIHYPCVCVCVRRCFWGAGPSCCRSNRT